MLLTRRRALAGCGGALMVHSYDGNVGYARHQQDRVHEVALRSGDGLCAGRVGRSRSVRFDRHPSIPAATLSDFIAYAKSRPGLAYGSAGIGSPQHLAAETLSSAAGPRHPPCAVSRQRTGPARRGRGAYSLHGVDLQPALPSIRQGKVRALGVTAQKRVAAAPDIPTLAESGFPIRVGRVAGCCCAGGHATRDHRRIGKTDQKAPRLRQASGSRQWRSNRSPDRSRTISLAISRARPAGGK
jgi:hypothetical protein